MNAHPRIVPQRRDNVVALRPHTDNPRDQATGAVYLLADAIEQLEQIFATHPDQVMKHAHVIEEEEGNLYQLFLAMQRVRRERSGV